MINLQELAGKEENLLSKAHEAIGSMDEKSQQLKVNGTFEAYRRLYHQYVSLAKEGNLEALKRAFFIQ